MTFGPVNSLTAYLPTSRHFPIKDERELQLVLTSSYTDLASSVNIREIAQYDLVELLTAQQFFMPGNSIAKRLSYRKVFDIGAIAAGATVNIPHGIVGATIYTRISGTCVTDVVDYRPIPMTSVVALNQQIQIRVVGANIEIVNGAGGPNITGGIAILEYLKN